jgi:hypothetical protein
MTLFDELQNMYGTTDVRLSDLRIGSVVMVYNRDAGRQIKGTIDDLGRNGKNGMDAVGYTTEEDGEGYWAYIDQVKSIVTY